MGGIAHTVFYFIVALGILITIHEFGHFWVARKLGVKVTRFSIGFGKTLWSYQKNPESTEYVIAVVPLGGYVKMVDEREGEVQTQDVPYAFNRQSLLVRTAIVLAGPVFNLLLAVMIYWFVFTVGETGMRPVLGSVESGTLAAQAGFKKGDEIVSVAEKNTPTWGAAMSRLFITAIEHNSIAIESKTEDGVQTTRMLIIPEEAQEQPDLLRDRLGFKPWEPEVPPVIDSVKEDGPADRAELQKGDLIVSTQGTEIATWKQWVQYIRSHPEVDLNIIIERDGVNIPLLLHPAAIDAGGETIGRIGATVLFPDHLFKQMTAEYRLGIVPALGAAVSRTVDYSMLTLKMVGRMIIGSVSVENLSGPVSIAQYAGQSANLGLIQFFKFLAIVSISLGVLNLLPIPVLDGGHLLYFLIEAIKGSPVSENVQLIGQQVGIFLLISLMGLALFLDIERLLA